MENVCVACREEVNLKKSSVKNHLQSAKHEDSKSKLKAREKREQDIAQKHNDEYHLRGGNLPLQQQVFRVKVVRSFLRAECH